MFNIGPPELILILIVALVVVGPKRLPEMGRTIGKSLREFRRVQDDVRNTMRFDLDDEPEPPRTRSEFKHDVAPSDDALDQPESSEPSAPASEAEPDDDGGSSTSPSASPEAR